MDEKLYRSLNENETDYRRRRRGLGIRNAIKRRTNATDKGDAFGRAFFRAIIAAAPLTKFGPTNALIKGVAMMGGTHNTKGYSTPLYVGAEGAAAARESAGKQPAASTVKTIELNRTVARNMEAKQPPVQMLKDTVSRASYRAIMHECLCRKLQGCTDYPRDLGCLFVGPAAKVCVEHGIAREATVQECFDHIDRAQACGLSASAYFVEVEEYVWGFRDEDMPDFLEVCFCCPCCCSATLFEHGAGGELQRILHQGIGYSCVVDVGACAGCGACERVCPHSCISVGGGVARVNATCAGCGQCLKACDHGALEVRQTGETKATIEEYFSKLHATI